MKAVIKYLLITVLVIVLLPVLLGVALSLLVDPDDVKAQLIDIVEEQTRGSLNIDGAIHWRFFPSISLGLNQLTFRLPEDKNQPFAVLDELNFSVKLLPLLSLSLEADGLTVKGLQLHLQTDKNGVNNWEQIASPSQASATTAPDSTDNDSGPSSLAVDIATISIADSSIQLNNELDGSRYVLDKVNIESTSISANGKPFPLNIGFDIQLSEPAISNQSRITTLLSANISTQQYKFDELSAELLVAGDMFADKEVNIRLKGQGGYHVKNNRADLKNLSINVADVLKLALQANVSALDSTPQVAGNLSVESLAINDLMQALGMAAVAFENQKALSDISLKAGFSGSSTRFMLEPLTMQLDKTQLTGHMGIADVERSEYVLALHGDTIDIDDYSTATTASNNTEPLGDVSADETLLPLAALRDLFFKTTLGFDTVRASGLTITQLEMKASANKGLIELHQLAADFYRGNVAMNGIIDARRATPKLTLNAKVNGVNIQSLAHDVAEVDTIAGVVQAYAQFRVVGNSLDAMRNSLNGSLAFGVDNAVLEGLNVDKLACTAIAQVRGAAVGEKDWPTATAFKKLGGIVQFKNGVGSNNDLRATLDNMQINGKGVVNLPANSLDYRLALNISGDLSEPQVDDNGVTGPKSACAINKKYRDITWPLRCKGLFSDAPSDLCGIDTERLAKVTTGLLKAEAKSQLLDKLFGDGKSTAAESAKENDKDQWQRQLFDKLF